MVRFESLIHKIFFSLIIKYVDEQLKKIF